MNTPCLELRDVTYAVNGRNVLYRASWAVARGEHWAILGPNGAGKSTLLRIICGDLWPNAGGEVVRNGEPVVNLGDLRRSIGWVTSTLAGSIPAREPVLDTVVSGKFAQLGFWEFVWQPPTTDDVGRARHFLDELGCGALGGRQFGTLSQGEQQKVLICRARMADPYLIMLDEPCAGMDPGARETFLASLEALGRSDTAPSLIYVTHHVEEILPIFTRVLVLRDGRVLSMGPAEELLTPGTIGDLYGIAVTIEKRNGRYWAIPG